MVKIEIISIIVLAAVLIILLILKLIESKLSKEVSVAKTKRDELYQKEINNINLEQDDILKKTDAIARNFFYEAYDMKMKEYSEMEEKFKEMKNKEGVKFCRIMAKNDYSNQGIEENEKIKLKSLLRKMTNKTHIISKIEKEDQEVKSEKEEKKESIKK